MENLAPMRRIELTDGFAAERVIDGDRSGFYNTVRPHSALAGCTPEEAYRDAPPVNIVRVRGPGRDRAPTRAVDRGRAARSSRLANRIRRNR